MSLQSAKEEFKPLTFTLFALAFIALQSAKEEFKRKVERVKQLLDAVAIRQRGI